MVSITDAKGDTKVRAYKGWKDDLGRKHGIMCGDGLEDAQPGWVGDAEA